MSGSNVLFIADCNQMRLRRGHGTGAHGTPPMAAACIRRRRWQHNPACCQSIVGLTECLHCRCMARNHKGPSFTPEPQAPNSTPHARVWRLWGAAAPRWRQMPVDHSTACCCAIQQLNWIFTLIICSIRGALACQGLWMVVPLAATARICRSARAPVGQLGDRGTQACRRASGWAPVSGEAARRPPSPAQAAAGGAPQAAGAAPIHTQSCPAAAMEGVTYL